MQWLSTQVSDRPQLSNAIKKLRITSGVNSIHVQHTQGQTAAAFASDITNICAESDSDMSTAPSFPLAHAHAHAHSDDLNTSHASPCHMPVVCNQKCTEVAPTSALDAAPYVQHREGPEPGGDNHGTSHVHDLHQGTPEDGHNMEVEGIRDLPGKADSKHPSSMLSGAALQNRSDVAPGVEEKEHDEVDGGEGGGHTLPTNTTGEVRQGIYRVFRASNTIKKPPSDLNGERTPAAATKTWCCKQV